MREAIASFFEHFEAQDWVTFSAAVAAILFSAATLLTTVRSNRLKRFELQAEFTVRWAFLPSRDYVTLLVENTGNDYARNLTITLSADPTHLLGGDGTVVGPVKVADKASFGMHRLTPTEIQHSSSPSLSVTLDWTDRFGLSRRQIVPTLLFMQWQDISEESLGEFLSPGSEGARNTFFDRDGSIRYRQRDRLSLRLRWALFRERMRPKL